MASSRASTVPARGDGISALTLSVWASISVSPSATCSPSCLLQAPTVISSAPCRSGITTSWASTLTYLLSSRHGHDVEELGVPVVDSSFGHEQDATRLQRFDELRLTADDHHLPRPLRHRLCDARSRGWVEVVGRLVEQQEVVAPGDQLRERQLRLLAAGKRPGVLPCDIAGEREHPEQRSHHALLRIRLLPHVRQHP